MVEPPRWTTEEFEAQRKIAIENFREERMSEPLEEYLERFDEVRGKVEDLLEMTVDLTQITAMAADVLIDPGLYEAVRYLAGPPISKDDLETLTDAPLSPTSIRKDPERAKRAVEIVLLGLDRNRFPWIGEGRDPTEAERTAATIASSALMAARRVMTSRANEGKAEQEKTVAEALASIPMKRVPGRTIPNLSAAPDEGEFISTECLVGSRKADLTARPFDGRLMPIECKVSNSSTNSIKRLNNDAAAKAERWLKEFGEVNVIPTAVLSGVFKVRNLEAAQKNGLTIFWAHDLDRLVEFIKATRS